MSLIIVTTVTNRLHRDMSQLVIEFDWFRDPKGYRLLEAGRPKQPFVVRNGKRCDPRDPKESEFYRPLSKSDSLFRIFANTATTPEGVLDFVQRFGSLTWEGYDAEKGDQVNLVIYHASRMREFLTPIADGKKSPSVEMGRFQMGSISSLDAAVVWDPVTNAPKWELRPKTLLDALWLQCGQALTSGAQFRQCEHCGTWFEVGRGTGRRADAKFCSEEHKISFHSLKRSRE
jgi:hypothetical protein